MKIYEEHSSAGHKQLLGYECDSCHTFEPGEDLPEAWIERYKEQFCHVCQITCSECIVVYSIDYALQYFKNGKCENCQE